MNRPDLGWMIGSLFCLSLGLGGCASAPVESRMGTADLKARSGSTAEGHVHFHQLEKEAHVAYEVKNLPPKSKHGFHIHEKGDCSAPDASSAGGHYNPHQRSHGGLDTPERHVGDLGNITTDELGVARGELKIPGLKIKDVKGLAVVVHAKADDLKTNPSGDSGARIACGVIELR